MAVKDYYAAAYQYSLSLIETDLGDCGLTRHGQSVFAHSKKAYQFLKMELDHSSTEAEECRPFLLDRDHVRDEAGTDIYQGALVYPGLVSVDPGRYHHSLVEAAQHAGARFVENCRVNNINFSEGMFTLSTVMKTIKVSCNQWSYRFAANLSATSCGTGDRYRDSDRSAERVVNA